MTKTKKQLRAEAVERLRKLEGKAASYADYCKAMVDCPDGFLGQVAVTQSIDLLTDDDANDDSTPEKVVSGSEPCVTPESCRQYADQRKQGDDADCESCDSREKLEADASELVAEYAASGDVCDALYHGMLGLLDRQAAITAEETSNAWEEYRDATQLEIAKYEHDCELLFDEKRELTAERDEWKAKAGEIQQMLDWEEWPDGGEINLERAWVNHMRTIEQLQGQVKELTAERDYYRDKFGKCLDYTDAIHALIDDEGLA